MRCTQLIGLTKKALEFLRDNEKIVKIKCSCPHCTTEHLESTICEDHEDASSYGMFDDGPMLNKYQLKDDSWAYEYVQEVIWSSGPMIYLSIQDHPELDWSQEELGTH